MTKGYYILILLLSGLFSNLLFGQREDKITFNEGVNSYRDGNYADALTRFEAAYQNNSKNTRALYNAGNAAYLKGDFEQASQYYSDYAKVADSPKEIAKAYFNQGNTFLQQADAMGMDPSKMQDAQKLYKQAFSSFKNSLKYNPSDKEAKYNLTYALSKIQQNQNQQDQNQDQNEQNQDQEQNSENQDKNEQNQNQDQNQNTENQDQQDGEQDQNQKDQKGDQEDQNENQEGDQSDENDQNGDEENEEEQEEQGNGSSEEQEQKEQEAQVSRAQAEQDLDAINEEEGKILKKVYGSRGDKKGTVSSGKDW